MQFPINIPKTLAPRDIIKVLEAKLHYQIPKSRFQMPQVDSINPKLSPRVLNLIPIETKNRLPKAEID